MILKDDKRITTLFIKKFKTAMDPSTARPPALVFMIYASLACILLII